MLLNDPKKLFAEYFRNRSGLWNSTIMIYNFNPEMGYIIVETNSDFLVRVLQEYDISPTIKGLELLGYVRKDAGE